MTRWLRLCQECWQERHPDSYLPAFSLDFDRCDFCGHSSLVYGASSGLRHEDSPSLQDVTSDELLALEAEVM
jgi:hypothetical protein